MTNYSAGSASIDIGSNLHNFHRDVRAKVESEDVSFFVDILPDMTGSPARSTLVSAPSTPSSTSTSSRT